MPPPAVVYARRRPEETTLYKVVQDNLATLYEAVEEGALPIRLPAFVRKELEGFLDCGLLCRGFAHVQCVDCSEKRLVAFGCGGRGFCPSCLGRKMASRTLNLTECVLPAVPVRQWVLTFPFAWRSRLGFDAPLFGALTRLFVQTVLAFYTERLKEKSGVGGKSGAVVALQRTSSDMRLNPHLHVLFLDGVYREEGEGVVFHALPHLSTRDVGSVLERAVRRIERFLKRRGLLRDDDTAPTGDGDADADPDATPTLAQGHEALCASASSGTSPPAGPEFRRKTTPLGPLASKALQVDKPLCASLDHFTLHAATRAGALDARAREALVKYVLRPPLAQDRVTPGPDGLVRLALKRPFADGTVAIDLDPLSLLARLAASVPAKGTHTVRYAGVLASASTLRSRVVPVPSAVAPADDEDSKPAAPGCRYRTWAELLAALGIDALECPKCAGRMRVLRLVREEHDIRKKLAAMGEATEPPARAPARAPPYWASRALRIRADADAA